MNASPVSEPPVAVRATEARPLYRFSVLLTGAGRMWRASAVVVPAIVVNALAQGLLVLPTQSAFAGWVLVLTALASAALLVATLGVILSAALASYPPDRPSWAAVHRRLGSAWLPYVAWTAVLFLLTVVGFAFWTWPGAIVVAAGLFVPLAAIDGAAPLRATWSMIRRRPLRWAVTVAVVLALATIGSLLTAVLWFFVPLYAGVAFASLMWGLLVWWWATGLAGLYLTVKRAVA